MTEREIYDGVIAGGTADFSFVVEILRKRRARWCVVGGLAANVYTSPVYSADAELVVNDEDLELVLDDLRASSFSTKSSLVSVNAQRLSGCSASTDHKLVVQFMRLALFQSFVERAVLRPIFGSVVPVASLADVVKGILRTRAEPTRRASRQAKDKLDLMRLAEAWPAEVEPLLPPDLQAEAVANRISRIQEPSEEWDD